MWRGGGTAPLRTHSSPGRRAKLPLPTKLKREEQVKVASSLIYIVYLTSTASSVEFINEQARCLRKDGGSLEACSETYLLLATLGFFCGSSTLEASCRRAACSFMPQSVHWNSLPLTDLLGGDCVTTAGSSSTATRYGGQPPATDEKSTTSGARRDIAHRIGSDRRISTGIGRKAHPRASRFTSAAPRARRSTASRLETHGERRWRSC